MKKCKVPKCSNHLYVHNRSGYCTQHADNIPLRRFKKLKRSAKLRGVNVALSYKAFDALIKQSCTYCGKPLDTSTGSPIDRIDSSKGYVKGNVIPCCGECNALKGNLLTFTETKAIVKSLKKLRGTEDIWSHKSTTAQKRRKRRKTNGV